MNIKMSFIGMILGGSLFASNFIGFGGLDIYKMERDQAIEYINSYENPVTRLECTVISHGVGEEEEIEAYYFHINKD